MLFSPWVLKKKGLLLSLLGGILALLTVCGGRLTPEVSIVLARGFGLDLIRLARSMRVAGDVLCYPDLLARLVFHFPAALMSLSMPLGRRRVAE